MAQSRKALQPVRRHAPLAYRKHGQRVEYHLSELARYLEEIDA